MNFKALIFDFDLTLADSTQGIYQCMCHSFEQLGFPKPDFDAVMKTIGNSLMNSFLILTGNSDKEIIKKFLALYGSHADKVMNPNTFIYPEVFEIMPKVLTKGLKTAIVSTKFRFRIEEVLKTEKIENYFNYVIGGEDVKNYKPDPEGLLHAIEKIGINKAEALYIGDSMIDAQTALNANVCFCGVLTGTTTHDDFKEIRANFIINDLKGLSDILRL